MERERLTELIEAPGRVAAGDLAALRELGERYPWFSGAHLLRAAGEHAADEVLYEETLRHVAAHLPSRAALFDAVHVSEPPPRSADPQPAVEQEQPVGTPEPAPSPEPRASHGPTTEATDELDREVRQAALASSYELLLEHGVEPPVLAVAPTSALEVTPTPAPADAATEARISPQEVAPGHGRRMAFTAWLGAMPAEGAAPSAPEAARKATAVLPEAPADTGALIERFIQQSAPLPERRAEFFSPQQAAKRSLDDTAGIVTETLARIHVKQGNLAKAIDTYARLALKYPDRSTYFAALQKELEEQLRK
ncbi:MAG: hypothetical protein KIT10_13540 [Flavobacteriales bacterium]|nr:hypothetical protein [Flavobacteriales bacterium]